MATFIRLKSREDVCFTLWKERLRQGLWEDIQRVWITIDVEGGCMSMWAGDAEYLR